METISPEPDDAPFGLVEQYDSIEDPYLRSEFLDAVGTTRSYINALRLRRDKAARKAAAQPEQDQAIAPEAPGPVEDKGPQHRPPRSPVRPRSTTTRPPKYAASRRNKRRRNRRSPEIVVIIFKLD
ncbi:MULTISPECIES: hypothetical protein [unclassified Streptomyces]|uniref:hypothetical protein n=1 Tax=unclassified Streptomyces TaxID=2593676 RepID=UPI002E13AE5B|nr:MULTISPECIES: hypothetical protein [unclassified Streptomyces]WSQ79659.1 hypothetical protein OG725_22300 [Streptomyces sp. NBC_01213]WSQ87039.1 hypothetical protein OG722_22980 [Streptomyces sp. NBC_01212]WSR50316.1 hypothetical protein OG279_22990 [Streptomyces sp. NBC_01201]